MSIKALLLLCLSTNKRAKIRINNSILTINFKNRQIKYDIDTEELVCVPKDIIKLIEKEVVLYGGSHGEREGNNWDSKYDGENRCPGGENLW